jgi:GTP pyrophosphokinase
MKTASSEAAVQAPSSAATVAAHGPTVLPHLITATSQTLPEQVHALARARSFAEPLIATETMESGENTMAHADAVAAILKTIGGSETMQAAIYLVHASVHLNRPRK